MVNAFGDFDTTFSNLVPFQVSREKFEDNRGSFEMIFQNEVFQEIFPSVPNIKQVNQIIGKKDSVRGFHFSAPKEFHWKFVTCAFGMVRDAVLDVRQNSETFGKVSWVDIDYLNSYTLIIPPGFAHAVQNLTHNSITIYATNIEYRNNKEFDINPLDDRWSQIWSGKPQISARDFNAPYWHEFVDKL